MSHKDLYEKALAAIQAVHGDTSVSLKQTLDSLEELNGEIEILVDAVEEDIERSQIG